VIECPASCPSLQARRILTAMKLGRIGTINFISYFLGFFSSVIFQGRMPLVALGKTCGLKCTLPQFQSIPGNSLLGCINNGLLFYRLFKF
jgi:hypothetical protein